MSIRQTTLIGSSLGPMTAQVMEFGYIYYTRNECPPVKQTSNPVKRVVGYPMNSVASIAALDIYCLVGHSLL